MSIKDQDHQTDPLFFYHPAHPADQLHPNVLAYMGDTLYDLFIRQRLIHRPNHRLNHMHKQASGYVSARSQAAALMRLEPLLTEEEREIVRRGRNAKSASSAKNAQMIEYRMSTAFECLLGYLYYKQRLSRLRELMEQAADLTERKE